jgi:hypothetical protein
LPNPYLFRILSLWNMFQIFVPFLNVIFYLNDAHINTYFCRPIENVYLKCGFHYFLLKALHKFWAHKGHHVCWDTMGKHEWVHW